MYPITFAFFKLIGGVSCFFCNIFICLYSTNMLDVVKDFVAVVIISEIDNIIAATLTSDDNVPNMKLHISRKRMRKSDSDIWNEFITPHGTTALSCTDPSEMKKKDLRNSIESGNYLEPIDFARKIHLALDIFLYRIMSLLYHVIYYYFAPFWISIIIIYAGYKESVQDEVRVRI